MAGLGKTPDPAHGVRHQRHQVGLFTRFDASSQRGRYAEGSLCLPAGKTPEIGIVFRKALEADHIILFSGGPGPDELLAEKADGLEAQREKARIDVHPGNIPRPGDAGPSDSVQFLPESVLTDARHFLGECPDSVVRPIQAKIQSQLRAAPVVAVHRQRDDPFVRLPQAPVLQTRKPPAATVGDFSRPKIPTLQGRFEQQRIEALAAAFRHLVIPFGAQDGQSGQVFIGAVQRQ